MVGKKLKSMAGLILLLFGGAVLAGCGGSAAKSGTQDSIKVGVTGGPHAEIMEVVKQVAAKDGLNIEIVEFSDYMAPNIALNEGEIDANSYQHQPWLDTQIKDHHYELVGIGKTVIAPLGIYSKKIKNINDIPQGGVVAIPNDPTNGGRALTILAKAGLIKVKQADAVKVTVADIVDNPKQLKIIELDAAQVPRSLDDVDIAAINTNYAMVAGLSPTKDAIASEDSNSPYANLLVVRTKDKDKPVFQKLVKAYHSPEVKQFVLDHFQGSLIPAW